jgi:protein-S-isoprenylcysteine O-methyltransferase Ste14
MLSVFSWITVALWIGCFAWLVARGKSASHGVRVYGQNSTSARVFKVLCVLCMFAVLYFPRWFRISVPSRPPGAVAGVAGVVLCAAGILLVILARRALGRNWSDLVVLKENHELVCTTPYNLVRHPLYAGMILATLGSALTVGSRAGYGIAAIYFLGLFVKSRKEEAPLTRQFPENAQYRQRVAGFIPFLL